MWGGLRKAKCTFLASYISDILAKTCRNLIKLTDFVYVHSYKRAMQK